MARASRSTLAYTLYTLALLGACLYYRFPAEDFRRYLSGSLTAAYPGIEWAIGGLSPVFPPGIALGPSIVRLNTLPGSPGLQVDSLRIFPDWGSWLQGTRACRFRARLHHGQARGRIGSRTQGTGWQGSGEFAGIDLSGGLSGRLEGKLSYRGPGAPGVPGSSGTARLRISQGRLPLAEPFFGLSEVPFQNLTAEVVLEGNVLKLKAVRIRGPALEAEMAGKVHLAPEPRRVLLEIRGRIRPFAEFFQARAQLLRPYLNNGTLSFSLTGTLAEPVLRLS